MITMRNKSGYSWLNKDSFLMSASTGASGANLVAIDSKIEQAMDLVKTHLMYAVREEVEVLRAKITDLEDTVLTLEAENRVLRDNIAPEVLTRLSAALTAQHDATASTHEPAAGVNATQSQKTANTSSSEKS